MEKKKKKKNTLLLLLGVMYARVIFFREFVWLNIDDFFVVLIFNIN